MLIKSGQAGTLRFRAPSVMQRTLVSWNPALGGGYRYANHFVGIFSPMDCRGFRSKHVAFVDDFLSGEEVVAMQGHLLECAECATHDVKIRRALLLFRNLPAVEPSPDFYSRLSARIESERAAAHVRPTFAARGPGIGTFMSIAAGLVTVGYVTAASLDWTRPQRDVAFARRCDAACASTAVCRESGARRLDVGRNASVADGRFAEQAPMRFAQVQFTQTSLKR
jgi:hypothetical protein